MNDGSAGQTQGRPSTAALPMVWRHRALLASLVQRDIRNRYQGSVMGVFWALVHPLALLGLYALVFEVIFKVKIPNLALDQPYVLFIAVVLWPWLMFHEALTRGTAAVVNNSALVKKVAFEHELLIYSAVLSSFVVHLLGYALVLLVLALMGMQLHPAGLLALLGLLPLLMLLATACALVLGALQVFVRDVEQALQQILAIVFYATPILYPLSLVPEWLRGLMVINPLAALTEPMRAAWLQGQVPDLPMWGLSWGIGLALAWAGRWLFLRLSPFFEDAV
jgi:lipopolysaccharide transport system permease protein